MFLEYTLRDPLQLQIVLTLIMQQHVTFPAQPDRQAIFFRLRASGSVQHVMPVFRPWLPAQIASAAVFAAGNDTFLFHHFTQTFLDIMRIMRIIKSGGKSMTARERDAGWVYKNTEGSHKHFVHPTLPGKITIPQHPGDLKIKTANSILKQAGLR